MASRNAAGVCELCEEPFRGRVGQRFCSWACMHAGRSHGLAGTPTYRAWVAAKRRCRNPTSPDWPRYGGRGIRFATVWDRFEVFLRDMGLAPHGLQLDRIDNDGHYEPGNCRWATPKEQATNRRSTRWLTLDGATMSATDWAAATGIALPTIWCRLARGWPVERALRTPPDERRRRRDQR
jgi:hypothetical protein